MNPLISICIPNYNYEKYIGEAIDSVLSQTYQNFEIIIFDNASTDNSLNIINSYTDRRIKLHINPSNINLYENINRAMSYATGDLICVLHSDDFYHENFLEEIVKAYRKYPDQKVFVTGVYNYHSVQKDLKQHAPFPYGGIKSQNEVITRLIYSNNIGNGVNVCFHKDVIRKAGMYSSAFCFASDYDFLFRMARNFDFVYIPKFLAFYRIHGNNLSHSVNKNLNMFLEGHNILEFNLSKIKLKRSKPYINLIKHRVYVKSVEFTMKYKSGSILRQMFSEFFDKKKFCSKDLTYYVCGFISRFVNESSPAFVLATAKLLFRAVLFLPNIINEQRLSNLVNNEFIEVKSDFYKQEVPTFSS